MTMPRIKDALLSGARLEFDTATGRGWLQQPLQAHPHRVHARQVRRMLSDGLLQFAGHDLGVWLYVASPVLWEEE